MRNFFKILTSTFRGIRTCVQESSTKINIGMDLKNILSFKYLSQKNCKYGVWQKDKHICGKITRGENRGKSRRVGCLSSDLTLIYRSVVNKFYPRGIPGDHWQPTKRSKDLAAGWSIDLSSSVNFLVSFLFKMTWHILSCHQDLSVGVKGVHTRTSQEYTQGYHTGSPG